MIQLIFEVGVTIGLLGLALTWLFGGMARFGRGEYQDRRTEQLISDEDVDELQKRLLP